MSRVPGVLALAFLVWLPGFATVYVLGSLSRERRAIRNPLKNLFVQIAAGLAVCALLALFSALVGFYSPWAWSAMVVFYSLAAIVVGKLRGTRLLEAVPFRVSLLKKNVGILLIMAIAFILLLPPFMTVFAERDDGVYSTTAAIIRNTGKVHVTDTFMSELEPEELPLFYRSFRPREELRIQEKGFMVRDFSKGLVIPQFVYLYQSLLAVFMSFLGFKGGFFLLTGMAVLSTLALYLIGSRISGKWCGAIAAALLSVNLIQIYFGKWTGPEIPAQFFFLSGMYCLLEYLNVTFRQEDRREWLWGVMSAILLGCSMLAHVEMSLMLVPILFYGALIFIDGGLASLKATRHFFMPFLLVTALALWLAFGVSGSYTKSVTNVTMVRYLPGGWGSLALIAVLALVLTLLLRGPLHGVYLFIRRRKRLVLLIAVVLLVAVSIVGWFVRPSLYPPGELFNAALKAKIFPAFVFYLTPLGAVLAIAGYCVFMIHGFNKRQAPLLFTGLAFSVIFLYQPLAAWSLIYTMRRQVPVVLPLALLMASYALVEAERLIKRRFSRKPAMVLKIVPAAALVCLLAWSLVLSLPTSRIGEGSESLALAHSISDIAEGDSVIVFDNNAGHVIASPVRYFFNRKVVKVRSSKVEVKPELRAFFERQLKKGPVYIVTMGDNENLAALGLELEYVGRASLEGDFLEQTIEAPSTKTMHWAMEAFKIFKLTSVKPLGGNALPENARPG